jgi:uncharacterized membrane protein YgcG
MQPIYYGWDAAKEHDQEVGHQLVDRHASTIRTVEKLPDGIRTLTVSQDPITVSLLHDHVLSMEERMSKGLVMRRWDPFFPELFRHADEIQQRIEKRDDGIFVEAHSANPYVVQLLYSHANSITDFANRGWDAAREVHALPDARSYGDSVQPVVSGQQLGMGSGNSQPEQIMYGQSSGGYNRGMGRRGSGSSQGGGRCGGGRRGGNGSMGNGMSGR